MNKKTVAILGATSHIAKGLIVNFLREGDYFLHLFSRLQEKVSDFLNGEIKEKELLKLCQIHEGYENFSDGVYDVIINCVGAGTKKNFGDDFTRYFDLAEKFDNLIIDYLQIKARNALYISFSSGAIYGKEFKEPADENSVNYLAVNKIGKEDYYAIVRLNAEAKHRAYAELNIVDLRVFSYFSRFIDLEDGYFITELLKAVLQKNNFVTNKQNFVRDYLHPDDLFSAVKKCMKKEKVNGAFDINSAKPVAKKDILNFFAENYGLKIKVKDDFKAQGATGEKNLYYSANNNAAIIGYQAKIDSLENIKQEAKVILSR